VTFSPQENPDIDAAMPHLACFSGSRRRYSRLPLHAGPDTLASRRIMPE
jgi:hypothetical protein